MIKNLFVVVKYLNVVIKKFNPKDIQKFKKMLSLPLHHNLLLSFLKGNITERFIYKKELNYVSPLFAQERLQVILFERLEESPRVYNQKLICSKNKNIYQKVGE